MNSGRVILHWKLGVTFIIVYQNPMRFTYPSVPLAPPQAAWVGGGGGGGGGGSPRGFLH